MALSATGFFAFGSTDEVVFRIRADGIDPVAHQRNSERDAQRNRLMTRAPTSGIAWAACVSPDDRFNDLPNDGTSRILPASLWSSSSWR